MYTLRVRDLTTGHDLADELTGTSSWGGVAWSADGQWLFYARPDEQMRPHEIWRHRLGTPVTDDVLVATEPDVRFNLDVSATRSERWLVISSHSRTSSEVSLIPADDPTAAPVLVRPRADDVEYGIDHWGDRFVVLTNLDAPDFRVMTAPLDAPGEWDELLPHVPGRRFTQVEPFAGHLVLHEWSEAQPKVRVRFHDGTEDVLDFGAEPHDLELGANPEWTTTSLRVAYTSLTTPTSVYDVDVESGERVLRKRTPTPNVDLEQYTSVRTWATAPDGTKVPMDVVHHVDTPFDGTAPAVVYGYGSYEASIPPYFSAARVSLLDRGVRVGAGAPTRRRRARPQLVARRPPDEQAQHVHRHDGVRRAPRRRWVRRPARASVCAAAAPAGCSSGRASRCARRCSAAPSPRSRSSTSSRR